MILRKRPRPPPPAPSVFRDEEEYEPGEDVGDVWARGGPRSRALLEDAAGVAARLKADGVALAEGERFKAAVCVWDQAIMLTPADATLHDMKCQALNEAGCPFPAVQVRGAGVIAAVCVSVVLLHV